MARRPCIFAHAGQADEIAAEASRIFLGIQIQCANCHDHPSDKWKRQQFHQLAAFFPRVQVKRDGKVKPPDLLDRLLRGTSGRKEKGRGKAKGAAISSSIPSGSSPASTATATARSPRPR